MEASCVHDSTSVDTYHRVLGVNLQDFSEGRMCFSIVVLTEVDKSSETTNKHKVYALT